MGRVPKRGINKHLIAMREKKLIEKYYDCFECSVNHKKLKCLGIIKPTDYSDNYQLKIEYRPPITPNVNIISPKIEYNDDIHMYYDTNSLCLYYPGDMRWHAERHIYDTIIPWTAEWLVFYELYQITGRWKHPHVPHKRIKEKTN